MRIYHKGTITAELGLGIWAVAVGLASLRGHGYGIPIYCIAAGFAVGFLCIVWGIAWEMRKDKELVSESALTTLHWYARHCPDAKALLQRTSHPTWAEAFAVEAQCRKRARHP
ncbi:hypothetical protein RIE95_09010 [Acidithiobacillus thiooxidans]|uniref:hypothetical protein n=1 Tax=Acidithiobacillus thiooxidans TaxID=930 RepID=UPI0028577CEE|nr:hypothetical protein [Acidithiobacillus thiooxidans]MDD2748663.1 hypothetical protein [Acidithiobacillus sp.]MDR7927115.1 hypothetical protein [Acidithiobacillus thiooxidans]